MFLGLRLRYALHIAPALSVDQPFDRAILEFTLQIQDELIIAIVAGDAICAAPTCARSSGFFSPVSAGS